MRKNNKKMTNSKGCVGKALDPRGLRGLGSPVQVSRRFLFMLQEMGHEFLESDLLH